MPGPPNRDYLPAMRGLLHRWLLRPPPAPEERLSALGLPPLLERILLARGFDDEDTVRRFRDPKLNDLHDPSLLPGVDDAADRLVDAVRGGEQIAIYGDYDVDGITATAILFHVIRAVAPDAKLVTYVPHRLEEVVARSGLRLEGHHRRLHQVPQEVEYLEPIHQIGGTHPLDILERSVRGQRRRFRRFRVIVPGLCHRRVCPSL